MNKRTVWLAAAAVVCTAIVLLSLFSSDIGEALRLTFSGVAERPRIIVDPGHGGPDGGAVTADGVAEKDINLPLALKLRDFLTLMGYEVIMTRETDISIHDPEYTTLRGKKSSDLKNRMKIMRTYPDALFVSIHQNKFSSAKYFGTQVFYAPKVPESKALAECIQSTVRESLQPENKRQTKKTGKDIYLIYEAESVAVLVECGFLSNPREAALLQTDAYQGQMAFAITGGILRYRGEAGRSVPEGSDPAASETASSASSAVSSDSTGSSANHSSASSRP